MKVKQGIREVLKWDIITSAHTYLQSTRIYTSVDKFNLDFYFDAEEEIEFVM